MSDIPATKLFSSTLGSGSRIQVESGNPILVECIVISNDATTHPAVRFDLGGTSGTQLFTWEASSNATTIAKCNWIADRGISFPAGTGATTVTVTIFYRPTG